MNIGITNNNAVLHDNVFNQLRIFLHKMNFQTECLKKLIFHMIEHNKIIKNTPPKKKTHQNIEFYVKLVKTRNVHMGMHINVLWNITKIIFNLFGSQEHI